MRTKVATVRLDGLWGGLKRNRNLIGSSMLYVGERLVSSFVNFVVLLVLARIYAPAAVGVWSYSIAIIQLAAPFLASGAEPVVVRELVHEGSKRGEVLGSAALVIALTTIVAAIVPLGYLLIRHWNDHAVITIAVLGCMAFMPNFMLVIEHHFRAESKPIPIIVSRLAATVAGAGIKLGLALNGSPIESVAIGFLVEIIVQVGLLMLCANREGGERTRWSVSPRTAWDFARVCLPAMFSGVVVTLFFRVNYLMIEQRADFVQVGFYALAFNILQLFSTIPTFALMGLYPRLVKVAVRDRAQFDKVIKWLFFSGSLFGYLATAGVLLLGPLMVPLVFGAKYAPAATVLSIMFLALVVNTSGSVRACVINIDARQQYHMWSALTGLIVLVPVSWLTIPKYGAAGAAFAIVVSTLVAAVLTSFALPRLRPYAMSQLLALFLVPPFRSSPIVRNRRDVE